MKTTGPADRWGLSGVSPQVWDRIQSVEAVTEDERAADGRQNSDALWVLDRVAANARLLDLGCGSGRLMELHIARNSDAKGGWALGVDLSWPALEAAHKRLLGKGLQARLIRANLVDLQCIQGADLDAAACLFSTLGMIRGYGNRLRFLNGVYSSLKTGGALFIHAHARWWHLTTANGRHWLLRDIWARLMGRESAGEFRSPQTPAHVPSLGHFSKGELYHLVKMAGFTPIECCRVEGYARPSGEKQNHQGWFTNWSPAHGWLMVARK